MITPIPVSFKIHDVWEADVGNPGITQSRTKLNQLPHSPRAEKHLADEMVVCGGGKRGEGKGKLRRCKGYSKQRISDSSSQSDDPSMDIEKLTMVQICVVECSKWFEFLNNQLSMNRTSFRSERKGAVLLIAHILLR